MSDACNEAPEYEVGGFYWVTFPELAFTNRAMADGEYVYRGRSASSVIQHVLEARYNAGQFITLSNTQMEKNAKRTYDNPQSGETWELEEPKPGGGRTRVTIEAVTDEWVILPSPFRKYGGSSEVYRRAVELSTFRELYRRVKAAE